jgi:DivIVA domain-containing protein
MDRIPLTPADVRGVVFDKAPLGKRGYDEDQVDAFLDLIEATLIGNARLTADEVRNVVFEDAPRIKRGYHEDQVDAFLDAVVDTFEQHERAVVTMSPPIHPGPSEQTEPMAFAHPPLRTGGIEEDDIGAHVVTPQTDLLALPLPPAPPGTRGYRPGDVEKLVRLLTRAVEDLNGPTAEDIRTARLHRTFFNGQGYRTDVVDTLIAAWVEELRRRDGGTS